MKDVAQTVDRIQRLVHQPRLIEVGNGVYACEITKSWPFTDARHLPRRQRQDIDCNGDGRADTRTSVSLTAIDANGNGILGDVGDAVQFKTVASELLDPCGPEYRFTTGDGLRACEGVAGRL